VGLASGHGCQGPDAGQQEGSDASQQEDNLRRHPRNISISRLPPHNRENHLAQVKELVASYEEVSESIMPAVRKARKIISEVKTAETSTRICQRGAEETGILGRDIRMHCVGSWRPQKRTNQLDQSRLPAGEFRFMSQETFPDIHPGGKAVM